MGLDPISNPLRLLALIHGIKKYKNITEIINLILFLSLKMEICKYKDKNKIILHIKKNYYGLSILKVFLVFDVIKSHCLLKKPSNKFILYLLSSKKLHVPSFIIMSFYFSHNILTSLDSNKIYRRLERIIIPYLGWPLISFIMANFINFFFKEIPLISLKNLLYQIILGHARNISLHFCFFLI